MASGSREATLVEDEELKADGKKRKFKPLQAMRKLFSKGRRKAKDDASPVSVVAIKARSTNTLQEDDDDDGGFRNRQSQPRLLGGTRSISEDSVFSPERETTNLQTLKQRAVSEESVPRTALQAELYTKINERRSQYSDEDDGLPHSPTPPSVTTADIIMCGSLKPLPAGGKSISRESDKSLISTDGSETEDDLFKSALKSAEAMNLSWHEKSLESETIIDFDKLASTELLKSKHAKDKISVKPRKGKTTRQSRKKQSHLFYSLPSLNEESPDKGHSQDESHGSSPDLTSETVDDVFQCVPSQVSPVDKASESEKLQKEERTISSPPKPQARRPQSVSSASVPSEHLSKPEVLRSSLKRLEAAGISEAATKIGVEVTKEKDKRGPSGERREDQEEIEASGIGASPTLPPSSLNSDSGEKKCSSQFVSSVLTSSYSSPPSSIIKRKSSDITTSHGRSSVTTGFAENLSFSEQSFRSSSLKSGNMHMSKVNDEVSSMPSTSDVSPCVSSPAEAKKEDPCVKVSPTLSLSPKEDYKMKRQVRSKTLPQPVSKEEQFSFRVQRAASHREEVTVASQAASPEVLPKQHFTKPGRLDSQSAFLKERVVESVSINEPEWITLAKKRMDEKREEQTSSAVDIKDPTSSKQKIEDETGSPGSKVQPMSDPAMLSAMSSAGSVSSIASRIEKMPGPIQAPSRDLSQKASVAISTAALSSRGTNIKATAGKPESSVTTTSELSPSISVIRPHFASSGRPAFIVKQQGKGEEKKEVKEEAKESTTSKDTLKLKAQTTSSSSSTSVTPPAWSSVVGSSFSGNRSLQSSMQSAASASTTTARTEVKASPAKSSFLTKSSNLEVASKEEHEELKHDIPAWRANLGQRKKDVGATSDIKIELIEISSNTRKVGGGEGSQKNEETPKEQGSSTKMSAANKEHQVDPCRGSVAGRPSKVLDMVKNFQNLQVS